MADRMIMICDIKHADGSEHLAEVRRTFDLDGITYEIDFCSEDNRAFSDVFGPWLAAGRRVGRGQSKRPTTRTSAELAAIREWAISNGHDVAPVGRVSKQVQAAYDLAHGR
jgi:hypothetical protein